MMERFMALVLPEPNSGCWLWDGNCTPDGYGMFTTTSPAKEGAHRFAYRNLVGPIPVGLQLDHKCRTRCCVNPEHLEPVSRKENILRGEAPPAINARRTHCVHGHKFTADNIRWRKDGSKNCRKCDRVRWSRVEA